MIRVGQGFDLHRLTQGRKLILGGVEIPFSKGLDGHSDADVLIHAVIDALLGASGMGDIGRMFPDTDKQYRDIDSRVLLREAYGRIYAKGYVLNNLDATIIIEAPKLAPYIETMQKNIAEDLHVGVDIVNIKAKTSEGIGIVGRGEAAVAQVVVLLQS